jgi:hypothetical protein
MLILTSFPSGVDYGRIQPWANKIYVVDLIEEERILTVAHILPTILKHAHVLLLAAGVLGFMPLPPVFLITLAGIALAYLLSAEGLKRFF